MWYFSWLLNALFVSIYTFNPEEPELLLYLAVLLLYALTRGCGGLLGWNLARAYRQIVEPEDQPRKYSPTCRLPTEVMYRILYHSLESIRNSGGADVQSRAKACMILSVTTRQWDWLAEREKRRWPMFSLEVRRGYKLPGLDSIRRRYHEKLGEALEERCQHCGLGGLAISLNDYSRVREEAVEEWTHILTWLIRGFKSAQQLQLLLQDGSESAAMAVDAALPGFPDLEKLFVLGSGRIQRGRVCLERAYTPACLRRIDLKFVNIVCWPSSLPTVQILTLDEVLFDPEEDLDICKDFFSSLPGLESLGLNGIDRLNPSSLAQLKTIGSITRLYLGPKCFLREDAQPRSQLLDSLTRYFRPKIKHLVLPSKLSSLSLVAALLNTRSGNHHPLYLSRLSTITVSVDRKLEHLQLQLEARILEMLKQKGIDNVALKRWMPWESDSLVSWEP